MFDDYDTEKIKTTIIITTIIIIMVIGGVYAYHYIKKEGYRTECENNPQIRYLRTCTSREDCIQKCMEWRTNGD